MTSRPALSVIVATRDRPASLRRLVSRLEFLAQRGWELIVVDNGSGPAVPDLPEAAAQAAGLRLVREPRRGKGNALNAGIAVSRGELLVFTDDDAEPDPAWLDELVAASLRHPDAGVFGGRILADAQPIPQWIRRSRNLHEILLTEHDLGGGERAYPPNRFPLGPNMAVRRSALCGIASPWAPDLGPGSSIPVGDERCFFYRIGQGVGNQRIYVPSALVRHRIEGRDLRLLKALRRCFWGGYTGGLLQSRFSAQMEPDECGDGMLRLLSKTRSWQELACAATRALGFVCGRLGASRRRRRRAWP